METAAIAFDPRDPSLSSVSKHTVGSIKDRYLTFELDHEIYGVEILLVKEIIGLQNVIKIPRTPEFVKGIMNLRGQIIPIIDLRTILGINSGVAEMDTAIIIVMIGNTNIGFIVDRVIEVSSIDEDGLSEPPDFGEKLQTGFIRHIAQKAEEVIMILDMRGIFNGQDIDQIRDISNNYERAGNQEA